MSEGKDLFNIEVQLQFIVVTSLLCRSRTGSAHIRPLAFYLPSRLEELARPCYNG
jgi:hypothetical protein